MEWVKLIFFPGSIFGRWSRTVCFGWWFCHNYYEVLFGSSGDCRDLSVYVFFFPSCPPQCPPHRMSELDLKFEVLDPVKLGEREDWSWTSLSASSLSYLNDWRASHATKFVPMGIGTKTDRRIPTHDEEQLIQLSQLLLIVFLACLTSMALVSLFPDNNYIFRASPVVPTLEKQLDGIWKMATIGELDFCLRKLQPCSDCWP